MRLMHFVAMCHGSRMMVLAAILLAGCGGADAGR